MFITSSNYYHMISFPPTWSHINKKNCEAHAIENSSHLLQHLSHRTRPPASSENAGAHLVSYSYTSKSFHGSIASRIHSFAANPIAISIFIYLSDSACSVVQLVPFEAYCTLLIGDNQNLLPSLLQAARSEHRVLLWRHHLPTSPTSQISFQFAIGKRNAMQ